MSLGEGEARRAMGWAGHEVSRRDRRRGDLQNRSMWPTTPHLPHFTGSRQSRTRRSKAKHRWQPEGGGRKGLGDMSFGQGAGKG